MLVFPVKALLLMEVDATEPFIFPSEGKSNVKPEKDETAGFNSIPVMSPTQSTTFMVHVVVSFVLSSLTVTVTGSPAAEKEFESVPVKLESIEMFTVEPLAVPDKTFGEQLTV